MSGNSEDVAAIWEIAAHQFASLCWRPGKPADWASLASDYLDGAALYPSARPVKRQTVGEFLQRMQGLANGKLASFQENLLGVSVQVFGNVATAAAACEIIENGKDRSRSVEMLLLVKSDGLWKIVAQAWDNETAENPIPAHWTGTEIKPGNFGDVRVKALLKRHLEGMHANSPPGHVFALDWSGLQRPEIGFYTLWQGEELLGCGALKALGDGTGEIKSMRTSDAHLRRGVGERILQHIMDEARRCGFRRLSLETGSGPAFDPALALYRKYGFADGEAFADYTKSPFNQFLHLDL